MWRGRLAVGSWSFVARTPLSPAEGRAALFCLERRPLHGLGDAGVAAGMGRLPVKDESNCPGCEAQCISQVQPSDSDDVENGHWAQCMQTWEACRADTKGAGSVSDMRWVSKQHPSTQSQHVGHTSVSIASVKTQTAYAIIIMVACLHAAVWACHDVW